jgi:hypothetical protein
MPLARGHQSFPDEDAYLRALRSGNRDSITIQELAGLNGPRFSLKEMSLGVSILTSDSALKADSFPPLQSPTWTLASRTLLAIHSSARQSQCFMAPRGKRIQGYKLEIVRAVNTAPEPESFFRVTSVTPSKICYEIRVRESGKTCGPSVACSQVPPAVYWRLVARVESVATS